MSRGNENVKANIHLNYHLYFRHPTIIVFCTLNWFAACMLFIHQTPSICLFYIVELIVMPKYLNPQHMIFKFQILFSKIHLNVLAYQCFVFCSLTKVSPLHPPLPTNISIVTSMVIHPLKMYIIASSLCLMLVSCCSSHLCADGMLVLDF